MRLRRCSSIVVFSAMVVLSFSLTVQGEQAKANWSRFRGPNGQGVAQADRIPVQFGPASNVLWKTAIPAGHSSPVVWENRIFLTSFDRGNQRELATIAVNRDNGEILWKRVVQAQTEGSFHALNNASSSTPVAADKHVYAYFGTYGLFCPDHAGTPVWHRNPDMLPS